MKRIGFIVIVALITTGCSFSINFGGDSNNTSTDKKEDLKLQITQIDEEAGHTVENNEMYKELHEFVEDNPELGAQNDFSVYTISPITTESEEDRMLLIAINRLTEDIEDVSFDLTIGNQDNGEYLWDDVPVTLETDEFGAIKPGHAIPFTLPLEEEQLELIETINEDNQIFKLEEFKYE